jgi:hypothetical protein
MINVKLETPDRHTGILLLESKYIHSYQGLEFSNPNFKEKQDQIASHKSWTFEVLRAHKVHNTQVNMWINK